MIQWEYKTLRFQTFKLFEAQLNHYGGQGWEAISFAYVPNAPPIGEKDIGHNLVDGIEGIHQVWVAILKRPLPELK